MRHLNFSIKKIIALLGFLPFSAAAQDCSYSINYSCWFTQQTVVNSLSWSPAGDKLASSITTGSGGAFCGTARKYSVLNMGGDTAKLNTTMSKNLGSYQSDHVVFTKKGGALLNDYYVSPGGTQIDLTPGSDQRGATSQSIDRDTIVYVSYSGSGTTYYLNYANIHDTSSISYHTISTISGIANNWTGLPSDGEAIATAGNRIYIATKNYSCDVCPTSNDPVVIKCRDFSGNTCPSWNDVIISEGQLYDMKIRPTDGLIFARAKLKGFGSSGWQAAQPGLVIFDSTGTLATGFNHTDLSLVSAYPVYANGGGKLLIRFDAAGNIFANMGMLEGNTAHGIGIYKFDPQGNLDLDFMRNVTNSYIFPGVTAVDYFDVNQVTGELAIAMNDGGWPGMFHALKGGEHKHTNNELWDTAFRSIYVGDGAGTGGSRGTSGYNVVQILYNNGKLKVAGESTTVQEGNCGTKQPNVVPYKDPALGTIQCNSLSFITAPTEGTASTLVVKVPIDVTTRGVFKPVTVSGSGMSMQDPYATFNASSVGINDFYVTLKYDGTALGAFNISVGGAGNCNLDLSDQTKTNPSVVPIWTPENCTYKVIGPDLK